MAKNQEYRATRIWPIIQIACRIVQKDPEILNDLQRFKANLVASIPELRDKSKCVGCEASMMEYPCNLTYFTSELLCEMIGIVHEKVKKGIPFTEANQVHRRQIKGGYTIASQFTIASKLGLVAKMMVKNKEGKMVHDQSKGWCITSRGFDYLAGKPVPSKVMVFRKAIQERFEDTITMTELYQNDRRKIDFLNQTSEELQGWHGTQRLLEV